MSYTGSRTMMASMVLCSGGWAHHIISNLRERTAISPGVRRRRILLVFLPAIEEWQAAVDRMEAAGLSAVSAFNAYWDQHGRSFEDPDRYRVVIQNAAWKV